MCWSWTLAKTPLCRDSDGRCSAPHMRRIPVSQACGLTPTEQRASRRRARERDAGGRLRQRGLGVRGLVPIHVLALIRHLARGKNCRLPKYRQSAWLADATGLSYSQAHRKMSGASSWTLEELERVGLLFGESLSQAAKSLARCEAS